MITQYLTLDLEGSCMRAMTLDVICNTFERISEQLDILHGQLNAPKQESEVNRVS